VISGWGGCHFLFGDSMNLDKSSRSEFSDQWLLTTYSVEKLLISFGT
jgi:hypothetical protein